MQTHVDDTTLFDAVVCQFTIHHIFALMHQSELGILDPRSALDSAPEGADSLARFNIIGCCLAVFSQEHLDDSRLGHQQRHLAAGVQTVGADSHGVVAESYSLPVDEDQLLGLRCTSQFLLDECFESSHRSVRMHAQAQGSPSQHSDDYIHDKWPESRFLDKFTL